MDRNLKSLMKNPINAKNVFLVALLVSSSLQGAVIDLFSSGFQTVSPKDIYDEETIAIQGSPFATRTSSVYGGPHLLRVQNGASFSMTPVSSSAGGFNIDLKSAAGTAVNLVGNGENYFMIRFAGLDLQAPVSVGITYYSTGWKSAVRGLLVPVGVTEYEMWVPFSKFSSKPGDFSTIESLRLTAGNFSAGDTMTVLSFTTVPEPGMAMLGVFSTALLCLRRKR